MKKRKIRKVWPQYRFNVRVSGRLLRREHSLPFDGRSRYYHCPRCSQRTLVQWKELDGFNEPPSPFPDDLRACFDIEGIPRHAYDFYCRECGFPVRLLFEMFERGMGGPWYASVNRVLELDE